MRAVIDTNVFVSGLLGSGACRKLYLSLKEGTFIIMTSEILLEELEFVIGRPKFHLLINSEERKEVISFVRSHALSVRPKEKVNICRDTKDNKVLECALEAEVDFIVSGDEDLLVLKSFRNIPIINPREFLKRLKE